MTTDFLSILKSPPFIGTSIGIFALGTWLGHSFATTASATSSALRSGSGSSSGKKRSWPNSYDVKVHRGSSDEEEEEEEGNGVLSESEEQEDSEEGDGSELKDFSSTREEVKLVLVIRTDLGMTKGKIAAQASHATLSCYKYLTSHPASLPLLKRWESLGQPKIALQVKSEEELLVLQAQAVSLGLCAKTIRDAGRTQIAAGSLTVLGVLGPKSVVDGVTGGLKLL